jgi:hypothetical protein
MSTDPLAGYLDNTGRDDILMCASYRLAACAVGERIGDGLHQRHGPALRPSHLKCCITQTNAQGNEYGLPFRTASSAPLRANRLLSLSRRKLVPRGWWSGFPGADRAAVRR